MITPAQFDALRAHPDEVLWENSRYSSTYVVDRSGLQTVVGRGEIPVVHLAQAEADERAGGRLAVWHQDADGNDVGGAEATIEEFAPDERIVLS